MKLKGTNVIWKMNQNHLVRISKVWPRKRNQKSAADLAREFWCPF